MADQSSNYSPEYNEFLNLPENDGKVNKMTFKESLKVLKNIMTTKHARLPQGKLPEVKPDMTSFIGKSDFLKFIWFGHSSLLLNLEEKIVLIDPVFGKSASPSPFFIQRFQAPVIRPEELPKVDVIVISHDHYDHLDKSTIRFFRNNTTRFIVPMGVGTHLANWGIHPSRIIELNWGESTTHVGLSFTAAPARHFSGRTLFDRNKTLWASWIIRGQDEKIFFSGDSGYGDHFKEIGKRYGPFDYAFMENGQYNERWPDVHMVPEETLQAFLELDAEYLVPVHWGMFDLALHHWAEPVQRLYKMATAWEIPIVTPRLGEIVDTSKTFVTIPWWENVKAEKEDKCPRLIPEFAK